MVNKIRNWYLRYKQKKQLQKALNHLGRIRYGISETQKEFDNKFRDIK